MINLRNKVVLTAFNVFMSVLVFLCHICAFCSVFHDLYFVRLCACVRACVRACVLACVCVCVLQGNAWLMVSGWLLNACSYQHLARALISVLPVRVELLPYDLITQLFRILSVAYDSRGE